MGEYRITGGNKLSGELRIPGGKNAVLPILASVVLNQGESIIHNCPEISDTCVSIQILEAVGCKVKTEGSTLIVDSSTAYNYEVPDNLVREMRSSIIFLGGILGRFKKVTISHPGGCNLGLRPIDLHIDSLKMLGVNIVEDHGFLYCDADRILGAKINLGMPSVGATENIMLTAVLAEGETIILNAAREPEIVDLQKFLNGMGADIQGAGTDCIVINGVKKLHNVEHTLIPDRIVAGTFLVGAAMTQGSIMLTGLAPKDMYPITSKLNEAGCFIREERSKIYLQSPKTLRAINKITTFPHPGFPNIINSK